MSDVDKELDKKEDEELDLEDQEQEDLQDDAENQDEDQQDDEQEEADDDDTRDDSDEEEEERKPSRREQLRIQQLLSKMKEDEPSPKKAQKAEDTTVFDEDDSESDAKYQKDLDSVYRFSKFETRLEVDAPRVEAKYSQLDKDSDDFNPVLADTINRMYLSFVGFDPKNRSVRTADIRYAEYVESVYELASEIAGETVERTTTNLRKQASKTGVRPGGGAPKRLNLNKAPSEMTDEELEAVINSAIPKKR
jgi:hypothetical protein